MYPTTNHYLRVILLWCAMSQPAFAGETITYKDGDTTLAGYWARSECRGLPRATVLVVHQWKGPGQMEQERANMLAKACYNAFVVDVYGERVRPKTDEEAGAEATKYKTNPDLARGRMMAALKTVKDMPDVVPDRIAVMGYCFGGTMALEMARSGAPVKAVVSFHGGLSTAKPAEAGAIRARLMVHHGDADPLVPPAEVDAFQDEMRAAKADWHLIRYANAVHAFTHRTAGNKPESGVAYNDKADRRSWAYTLDFFDQTF